MFRVSYLKRCWNKITIVTYIYSLFAKQIYPLSRPLLVELEILSESQSWLYIPRLIASSLMLKSVGRGVVGNILTSLEELKPFSLE